MSQTNPAPSDPRQEISLAAAQEQYQQVMKAWGKLIEGITPWLLDFGSWIFGGLIAFTLLIVPALLTIGPVDTAIRVSTVVFALALPLNLAGLLLLRLIQDMKNVGFEKEVAQAFQDIDAVVREQVIFPKDLELWQKRRTQIVLGYALGILTLSILLTLTGIIAALWHMAWWIGVAFFAMVIISLGLVALAIATSQPPDSKEEKERKRRDREEIIRQTKAQYEKNEE